MCGIAGYFSPRAPRQGAALALRMLRTLEHRGPDDQGLAFFDLEASRQLHCATPASSAAIREALPPAGAGDAFRHHLAFAHCRFSIVDLSAGGHQPMRDASGQACVSFNGEIYNYVELKRELEAAGASFRTGSDTEVLLAGYLRWGPGVFERLNGQWALSLYDARDGSLWLSRDRLGKVPLYYVVHGGCLYWASEIKALADACGPGALTVRAQAVDDFVVHGWRDRDGTFWNEVMDFPPASHARVGPDLALRTTQYWRIPGERLPAGAIGDAEAARRVSELLLEAIRIRVRADVPVAFELSGGIDSSAIVALAASGLGDNLAAYSVAFADEEANELPYARAVAERYRDRIEHRVIEPAADDFWRDADAFVRLEEEPFHAPGLHANQSLRRRIRERGTKVVLSGAAGDEVFAGYPGEYLAPFLRHLAGHMQWRRAVHELLASSERGTWKQTLGTAIDAAMPGLYDRLRFARAGETRLLASGYRPAAGIARRPPAPASLADRMIANLGPAKMNYWLRSANKANFGIPIEPRAPFLDYRLIDFAFTLPVELLIRDGWHKWILRAALGERLPPQVLWRKRKMGFPFPMSRWLAESRPQALANLADARCPFLDVGQVSTHYAAMAASAPYALWRLVSLGLWWKRVVEGRPILAQGPA